MWHIKIGVYLFCIGVSYPCMGNAEVGHILDDFVNVKTLRVIHRIEDVNSSLVDHVKQWLKREYGGEFDGRIVNIGDAFFHSPSVENLPLAQHRFSVESENLGVLVLSAPDYFWKKVGVIVVVSRLDSNRNCAFWAVEKTRPILSLQQLLDEYRDSQRLGEPFDCTPLDSVSIRPIQMTEK